MATYETELLKRCAAMQIEAMTSIGVSADAVPYFFHTNSDSFPYFTNRIADNPITDNGGEDVEINNPIVIMRLVVAHITSGYKGENEAKVYEYGPIVKSWFSKHMWLTSALYPLRMGNLQIERVTNNGGIRAFENTGIAAIQVGREIQLSCTYYETIDQIEY
jgi:hypothetical protein